MQANPLFSPWQASNTNPDVTNETLDGKHRHHLVLCGGFGALPRFICDCRNAKLLRYVLTYKLHLNVSCQALEIHILQINGNMPVGKRKETTDWILIIKTFWSRTCLKLEHNYKEWFHRNFFQRYHFQIWFVCLFVHSFILYLFILIVFIYFWVSVEGIYFIVLFVSPFLRVSGTIPKLPFVSFDAVFPVPWPNKVLIWIVNMNLPYELTRKHAFMLSYVELSRIKSF